ncbi:MAG: DNA replication/repair protein RecF [Alphaproteobacteria bacterium]|nr:DNA replication/repair protein RecF [Alphaproteobacteria bacterium]
MDAGSVWVSRLACSHFRSYAQLDVTLPEGPVAFVGSNGAGKTNLLEAISLFAPGRGLRGAPAAEVASRNAEGELLNGSGTWAVSAHVETPLGGRQLGVGLDTAGGKRVLRLDGKNKNGATAFAEIMPILWLTPDDDALWRGPALDRRRFFDQLVAAYDPGHVSNAQAYGQVMRQRLKILKDATKANTAPDTTWLDSLEESMARQGVAMAAARRGLMRRLSDRIIGGVGPFPGARLGFKAGIETALAVDSALDVEDQFRRKLVEVRARDGIVGQSTVGPHRSDLDVYHAVHGREASQCSTGEQKALLLAVILGHAQLLTAARRLKPIMLLDEVAAHLDLPRRAALLEALVPLGGQIWMTGTESITFCEISGEIALFSVHNGGVTQES